MTAPLKRKDIIQAIISNPTLNEEEKSLLVEEFVNEIKKEYPELKYHATKTDVSELELKLIKEIEEVRKEIKDLDLKLTKEIEEVRKEIKDLDLKLTKEIEEVRKEIKELDLKLTKEIEEVRKEIKELDLKLTKEIKSVESNLIKWMFGMFVAFSTVFMTAIKLFIAH